MKTAIECPNSEELRQLVDGSLSGDRQQECTEHIDSCPPCQVKLEELATGGTNLSRVVEKLHDAEPVASAAYWPALNALHAGGQPTVVPESGRPSRDLSLDFLQPPTDPAYLGRLAQFDVMRVLGRGGMGVVLEAFDTRLQRNVALKVLDPELASDEVSKQRFCREARTAASITHENVVAVHHVEKAPENGMPFLVMQLISGESLEQRLARVGKLPLREVVRIALQAAQGLAAAHAVGLIHRDIKPGNILLETTQDRVKLTDFGLARGAEDLRLTRSGFVSGTPLYMAPEQAMGEQPDPRSDLFSLGAVLYEMAAGHPPFAGNSALAILKQIADVEHRPLREVNPAVPDWLAETINRLLAKKPAERIQSAALLVELLEFEWAILKTTSEDVPTVCQVEERKRTIRNRWIASGVGATFLTLGLLGGWFLANRNGTPAPLGAAASAVEPVAALSANSGAVWSTSFDRAGEAVLMAVEDGSVRLWDLASRSIKATYPAHRGTVWVSQFSPDGEWFATAGDDGLIKLWKPSQPEAFQTFENSTAVRSIAFSHDGKTLFVGVRDGHLRVLNRDSTEPVAEGQHPGSVYAVAVSPDDETLATAGNDRVVRLWNARTLTPKISLEGHTGPIYSLSFHPDGRRLASVGWDKTVRIWDAGSGQLVKSWDGHDGDIWSGAYSPDGTRLATGGFDGAVKLWNAESGDLLATFHHKLAIHAVAFNQDGTRLASGSRDGTVRIWEIK
jgi:WD40 repeat protein